MMLITIIIIILYVLCSLIAAYYTYINGDFLVEEKMSGFRYSIEVRCEEVVNSVPGCVMFFNTGAIWRLECLSR